MRENGADVREISVQADVLIVEDSPTQALRLRHTLRRHDYQAVVAQDGAQALQMLQAGQVKLVISDVEMPVMDGYELCRRIKADAALRDIPVMLLTSLSAPRDIINGLECGADHFMVKPYDEAWLIARIGFMLNGQNVTAEPKGIEVFFGGQAHHLQNIPSVQTTVGLLLGTYETTLQKNAELNQAKTALEEQARALAQSNAELEQISRELRVQNQHMQADLNLAREIQSSFLPRQYPSFPHHTLPSESALRFCHRWIPTTTLGGDFFDVLALSETQAGVFICDVMGHGVRSALVTAMMRALVGERTAIALQPAAFMAELNRHLVGILQQTSNTIFASAFYMVADIETGQLTYANAGHPAPLWARRQANIVEPLPRVVESCGPVLGVFEDAEYEALSCKIDVDDFIVLFTDGLYEVEDAKQSGDEWGEERLLNAIRQRLKLPPAALFDDLMAEIQTFSGTSEFEDDVCLVGMEVAYLGA